jgi:RNA polymerase sigma factor (sigma-70 family)
VTDTFLHLSDPGLIALVARGDRDAFAEFYDRYGKTAYGLAYRVTRDVQLAEEVVQEAFLTVWRQASRFDGRRAKPSTWLLTITHHKAVDVVRREQLRHTEPAEGLEETADTTDVPREAWLGLQHDQVREALAALPDPQREVIELSYFEGYSQSELARRLGQPLGTIKSRTHTALTRLRAQLEERGITTENPWSTESSRT